jgi:hypothetical protein
VAERVDVDAAYTSRRHACRDLTIARDRSGPRRYTALTVYDDYGTPVNPIPEFATTH